MKRFAFAIVAAAWIDAQAGLPIPPPRPIEAPSLSTMRACQIFRCVRPGALRRDSEALLLHSSTLRGTPMYQYFMTDNAPHDGIYVAEDLDLPERRAYEEVAGFRVAADGSLAQR